MVGIVYGHAAHRHDIGSRDRARLIHTDRERRLGHIVVQGDDQSFEVLNDLMSTI